VRSETAEFFTIPDNSAMNMPLTPAAGSRRQTHLLIPFAALAVLALAACASGSSAGWTYAPPVATATAAAGSPGASESPGGSGSPGASESPSGSVAPTASPSGGSSSPGASGGAESPAASEAASPGASGGAGEVIELEETADLHITQNRAPVQSIAVTPGETVTFKVTNTAGFDHDFFIGPPDKLSANDVEGLEGIPTFTSGTQEFTFTIPSEVTNLEFACTLPGHYPSMHGSFTKP
jgi:uncharacterized cupredoxin-like copper-binding protein